MASPSRQPRPPGSGESWDRTRHRAAIALRAPKTDCPSLFSQQSATVDLGSLGHTHQRRSRFSSALGPRQQSNEPAQPPGPRASVAQQRQAPPGLPTADFWGHSQHRSQFFCAQAQVPLRRAPTTTQATRRPCSRRMLPEADSWGHSQLRSRSSCPQEQMVLNLRHPLEHFVGRIFLKRWPKNCGLKLTLKSAIY